MRGNHTTDDWMQPVLARGRTMRIVYRNHWKKTMKNRIKQLRTAGMHAFQAGMEAATLKITQAAHNLSYGEGYEVKTVNRGVPDYLPDPRDYPGDYLLSSHPDFDYSNGLAPQ